jgi:hypothetical protein
MQSFPLLSRFIPRCVWKSPTERVCLEVALLGEEPLSWRTVAPIPSLACRVGEVLRSSSDCPGLCVVVVVSADG